MVTGRPLFPGSNANDQLMRIFKKLGTPTEESWPEVKQLPDYKDDFTIYPPIPLKTLVPGLDEDGDNLLEQMLKYNPNERITAEKAMKHPYFADVVLPSSTTASTSTNSTHNSLGNILGA